jgi:fibronectin-binding autotransporter adhesin
MELARNPSDQKYPMKSKPLNRFLVLCAPLALSTLAAQAVTRTWVGADGNMNTPGNWSGGAVPTTGDQMEFSGSVGASNTPTFTASIGNALGGGAVPGILVTSGQSSALQMNHTGVVTTLRLALGTAIGVQINSGAGAVTFGDGAGVVSTAFNVTTNGAGSISFINNSSNTATFTSDATLGIGGGNAGTYVFNGTGNWAVTGVVSSSTSGSALIKNGSGTTTLNGLNTYNSTTAINDGILSANKIVVSGGNSSLGNTTSAVTLGGASTQGTLSYTGNSATYTRGFTVGAGGGRFNTTTGGQTTTIATGNITGTSGSFTLGGAGNTTVTSSIQTGSGGIVKEDAGTAALNAANTYSGITTINGGTLALGVSGTTGSAVAVGTVGTFDISAKLGAGYTVGTLTGAGTVNTGIGALTVSTQLAAGSGIDSLAINGNLIIAADGTASNFEVTTGDLSDLVAASNALTLNGILNVSNIGGSLVEGDEFNLFDSASVTGLFDAVNLPALDSGLTWDQSKLYSDGILAVVPEPAAALLGSLGLLALLRRRRA